MAHKVGECANEVPALFEAFFEGDYEAVRAQAEEISRLEHEADRLKDQVRDKLPKTIFLPVDRRDLLDVIASLDAIADCAEDVGILFTLREMERHEELIEPLKVLLVQVMEVVNQALVIMDHLDVLVEVGFKGPEAERIKGMIEELGRLEHEADLTQDELARTLFSTIGDDIKPGSLFLWNKILNKVGDVANTAEKAGTRVRLFIAK
jgi:predicted phosphate transport protein (TIGR00153 family)